MKIVAISSTKGGVGKSTLAAALAVRACEDYANVSIVDLDAQQSCVKWYRRRADKTKPEVFYGEQDPTAAAEKLSLTACDIAFFDTAPSFLDLTREAAEQADLVVIPTKTSRQDLESTMDAVQTAENAKTKYLCVFNDVNSRDGTLDAAQKLVIKSKIPLANTVIYHRVSHVHGYSFGQTAAEYKNGADTAASNEINALWLEIKALLEAKP